MSDYDPSDFTKCPDCHRSGTVVFHLHPDGDVWIECDACDSYASAQKLNQSTRTYR